MRLLVLVKGGQRWDQRLIRRSRASLTQNARERELMLARARACAE